MIERTCSWIQEVTTGELVTTTPLDDRLLIRGVSTDTRKINPGSLFVPLVGEFFDGHRFLDQAAAGGAVAAIWQTDRPVPENVQIPLILVKDTLQALQQLAAAYRDELKIPIIGITGSNGKTTTKDLVSAVLSEKFQVLKTAGNLNNHIGVPLTLLSLSETTEIGVVEVGMNHAGEISILSQIAKPNLAVVTNIGESHLEFLGSRAGIADAKLEICEGLAEDGMLIIHGDEPLLLDRVANRKRVVRVGFLESNDEYPVQLSTTDHLTGVQFDTAKQATHFKVPLLGKHNILNALYAIVIGRHLGLSEAEIQQGLAKAKISGMRLEVLTARNQMLVINDAYNASPTSMRAALELLQTLEPTFEKWALLGDIREIGPEEAAYHREIGALAIAQKLNRLYTIGERGRWIAEGAIAANEEQHCHIEHFDSITEAVETLQKEGHQNVLLLVKASQAMQLAQVVENLQ